MAKKQVHLNQSQQKAVEHKNGPLLVVAGAGTGKTRVITERIKHLIQHKKIKAQEVLALTFTEKASGEMTERVEDIMPLGYEEPWIYTFHSFCDRILKENGLEIGLDTNYKLMSSSEQWLLFRQNLFTFDLKYYLPLGNPTKFISAILKFISRLQDEDITPTDLQDFANKFNEDPTDKEKWQELANVYEKYQLLKISKSKLDFGDLITWTIKLFKERPNILKKYQEQFKHVLVDEFQDTNYSQYELVKLLCPQKMDKRTLVVVGDDSQSIYKFRGAAVSNILEFMQDYPETEMTTLLENYRSTQPILDAAYKLIQNNNPDTLESKLNISKKLESKTETKPLLPEILELDDYEDEVEAVVMKIHELTAREPDYTYKDIAILARANNHLDPFIMALRKHQIPYQLVGNRGLYDREEIRDILALLRTIINPLDAISLYRVLNIDVLEIPQEDIARMLASARYKKTDLWEEVKENKQDQAVALHKIITEYQDKITKETPVQIVYELVNDINYLGPFMEHETVENQLTIKNMDLFLNKVKGFEIDYRNDVKEIPTIVNLVDYLDLMMEANDNPAQAEIEDIETVKLMTVHASKGLEFPVVFMVNLVSDRFPTRNRGDAIDVPEELVKETLPVGDAHIQEERRLFYVGMTRAQKYLYLTYALDYGGKREKTPSGYLAETGLNTTHINKEELKNATEQKGLFGIESGYRETKVAKIKEFIPSFLSYTQISTFTTCALKYKFQYVLNIPTPPAAALSFGQTIHDTLRDYHMKLMFENKITKDQLLEMYEKNWKPLGFMNEKHRQEVFENGKKVLRKYYDDNPKGVKPMFIEKSFNLKIDGIKFYGRIDRVDPLKEGGVEIIDYKTGQAKTQKDVDKDDQVAFYAMGAKEALGLEPKKLTYYYVESGEKLSTTRTDKELEDKKREIVEVLGQIKTGSFEPTPGMHCQWCDYKDICPFAWRG